MGEAQSYVDQADHHRHLDQGTDNGGKCLARQSIPNTGTATAMASSKLLLAAVKASEVVCP